MSKSDALSAARCLFAIAMTATSAVPGFAVESTEVVSVTPAGRHDLYCLNVHDLHALAVNDGIIVSNCWDCLRYRINVRVGGAVVSDVFA